MDPDSISLVLATLSGAVAAGATSSVEDATSSALNDAYRALRSRISRLLRTDSSEKNAVEPITDSERVALRERLAALDESTGNEIEALTLAVIEKLPAGLRVQVFEGNQGLMVNDQTSHPSQVNYFRAAPAD